MKSETESQTLPDLPMKMSEPRRQHPVAALTNVLNTLRDLLVPLVIIFFFGGGGGGNGLFSSPWYLGSFLMFLLVLGVARWMRFTYRVEDDEIRIEYGLFVRKRSFIPRHRIQVIDISSGVLQRAFGLVSLEVQTAGGGASEAKINALTLDDALWIKENMSPEHEEEAGSNPVTGDAHGIPPKENETGETTEAAVGQPAQLRRSAAAATTGMSEPVYALSWRRLLIAGTTSGSFGIALSIVGTIFAQMNTVIDDDAVVDFIELVSANDTVFFIGVAVALIFVAWVLSIVGTVLSYGNFAIYKRRREMVISRGILEKKLTTIPYSRIQGIRIQEGVLRQPLGFCTLYVDSAGFGEQSGKSTTLFPLLRRSEAEEFIRVMAPEYDRQPETVSPPPRALRRYIIRTLIPTGILIGLSYWLLPFAHFILPIIPVAVVLGYYRWRAAAAGTDTDTLLIRYRNLAKTTVLMKRYRIQSATAWDNYFQRRRGLKSLTVNIASSDTGASFSALDLEADDALDFVEWVEPHYNRKQAAVSGETATETEKKEDRDQGGFLDIGY
ncbi:MAG: PH domain-containing protein [Balneolales bacterium]|nr:PH domain-containing protein [Balneolales bacterium]